ncbi:hypothetical protein QTN25_009774 [Entamoeba marina]
MEPFYCNNIKNLLSDHSLTEYFFPILKNVQSAFVLNRDITIQFIQQTQRLLTTLENTNRDITSLPLFKFVDENYSNPTKDMSHQLEQSKKEIEEYGNVIGKLSRSVLRHKSKKKELTKLIIQLRDGCMVAQNGYNEATEKVELLETQLSVLEHVNGLMKNKLLDVSSTCVDEIDKLEKVTHKEFQCHLDKLQHQIDLKDNINLTLQQSMVQLQKGIDLHKKEMYQELEEREIESMRDCKELFEMIMFQELKTFQQQLQTLYKNKNPSFLFTPPPNTEENMTFITEIQKDYYTLDNNKIADTSKIVQLKPIYYILYITLQEAMCGCRKKIRVEKDEQYCEWVIFLGKGIEDNTILTHEKDVIIVRYKKDLLWKREGNDLVVVVTENIPKRLTHPTGTVFEYNISKLPLILDGWGFNGGRCIIKKK